jgi:hypothetical protein
MITRLPTRCMSMNDITTHAQKAAEEISQLPQVGTIKAEFKEQSVKLTVYTTDAPEEASLVCKRAKEIASRFGIAAFSCIPLR